MGQRSIPAPFLTKTYELVDDESTNDVVSWGDEGSTFVVWKTAEFAKDLLPKYFKHNNFSSFVRQLNTYGFHKIVADKWEFANDNFKKGQKDLLSEIHRRKSSLPGKVPGSGGSLSVSGDEAGSTSTSSPGSVEIADLSGENEKLRQDNKMLFAELAHTRKYCEELMGFLTAHMNMGPDQINKIIGSGPIKGRFVGDGDSDGANVNVNVNLNHNDDDNDNDNDNSRSNDEDDDDEKDGLKIFGVWFKEVGEVVKGEKRGRCCEIQGDNNSNLGLIGPQCGRKVMKIR